MDLLVCITIPCKIVSKIVSKIVKLSPPPPVFVVVPIPFHFLIEAILYSTDDGEMWWINTSSACWYNAGKEGREEEVRMEWGERMAASILVLVCKYANYHLSHHQPFHTSISSSTSSFMALSTRVATNIATTTTTTTTTTHLLYFTLSTLLSFRFLR